MRTSNALDFIFRSSRHGVHLRIGAVPIGCSGMSVIAQPDTWQVRVPRRTILSEDASGKETGYSVRRSRSSALRKSGFPSRNSIRFGVLLPSDINRNSAWPDFPLEPYLNVQTSFGTGMPLGKDPGVSTTSPAGLRTSNNLLSRSASVACVKVRRGQSLSCL